jgi:hypothetical protein
MREKILGILVCTLMISSFVAGVSGNDLSLGTKEMHPFDIEDGVVSTTISVGRYEIKNADVAGSEIFVDGFGRLLIPGKPNLPSKIFSIAIPPGSKLVEVSFDVSEEVVLPGFYYVSPSPLPRVPGVEDPLFYEQESKRYEENYNMVYGSDDPYPSSVVDLVGTGGYRKYNLVDVRVSPFVYHPVSGRLIYYPEVTVHVSYTFPEGFSYDEIMVDDIPRAEEMAEDIVFNYDQAKNWYPMGTIGGETYDFVIVTLDSLTSSVAALVDWEEAKGRSVNVVTTSWIDSNYNGYDLAEKIRNFLRDKYPSEEWGILDVCVVGHWDDVPIRTCSQYVSYYGPVDTDLYYAELSLPDDESWDADGDHLWGENSDPIDFYSEVNVGRIPWSNPSIVEDICDKSVAYEMNDDPAFKKNILLLGAFFWDNDPNPRTDNAVLMEAKVDQDWMDDWTMTRMYEAGYSTYPMDYDLTYDNVKTVWSQGSYGFVDWAGHGSPTACYRYHPSTPFVDTDTCNYLNDAYPSIIFADACSNSDTDYLNIGQAMLKQGAVGFLGSTEVALGCPGWDNPMDGSSQSLDYFFTTCVTSGNYTQGAAHQWALREMYTNSLWDYTKYEMFEWSALWGNPDITMAPVVISDPPSKPDKPGGPISGTTDEKLTFTTRSEDPDGDQIYYMWDWGDGNFSDWLGPYDSGDTTEANYTWTAIEGDYQIFEVRVKAKDENGAKSDWSDSLLVNITKNKAPNIPTISGWQLVIGGIEYNYRFMATDPDGQDIYYQVDWDDGNKTGWLGPYSSGEEITLGHKWHEKGDYFIKAWARDSAGAKSGQGTYKIRVMFVINSVSYQSSSYMQMRQNNNR